MQPLLDGESETVVEVRCPNVLTELHFKIIGDVKGTIEVKCKNKRCTGGGKTVVLHRYSFPGPSVETLRFADPEAARARHVRKEYP